MTSAEVNRIRSIIDEVNDQYIIITSSQMAIINTPSTPIIFDDANKCVYYFKRSNRDSGSSFNDRRIEIYTTTYDHIESFDLLYKYDDIINKAASLGISPNNIERIKQAFERNHGDFFKNNENVIK